MKKYVMALDSGTTSNRCIIFDKKGNIVSMAQKEFTQYFPKPAWVEQSPTEIWSTQIGVCAEALNINNISTEEIAAIGITNQRETTIVWDKKTGDPIYNAIVWQCRRTANYCNDLKKKGYETLIKEKTGLVIDPYFSGTKLKWILDNVEGARERAERGEILFGTVDSYLLWKLTGGVHVTDVTNASRTMMFNIHDLKWDEEILKLLDIPAAMLPEVKSSSEIYGYSLKKFFGAEIPIAGIGGDQQCALFGQLCTEKGMAKNTYGTGAFVLVNTGDEVVESKNGLLSTVAWKLGDEVTYALEGSIFVAGSAIQWLRDGLRLIDSSEDSEYMATKVKDTNDVYVVPAFTGLGAPYWDPKARGIIIGLTRGTSKYHIIRATLESIAFLSNDVLQAMAEDMKGSIKLLKVDGGASHNNFLMEFQSNITGVEVVRPKVLETTAMGAAFFAGLAVGFWKDIDELRELIENDKSFVPENKDFEAIKNKWKKAVQACLGWA